MFPNFKEEKLLWEKGHECVVGLDEAGRGSLVGPVVAAAVSIKKDVKSKNWRRQTSPIFRIRDSKKLSEKQREFFYEKLTNHKDIQWGIGVVSERVIDQINILEATKLAMEKSLDNLHQKVRSSAFYETGYFLIIDGNFKLNQKIIKQRRTLLNYLQKSVIKGDEKVFSCTAAGIVAKVTRDRIMREMHKKYPGYGFDKHKGYGTKMHLKNLKSLGPCKIHRKTFYPVKIFNKSLKKLTN